MRIVTKSENVASAINASVRVEEHRDGWSCGREFGSSWANF